MSYLIASEKTYTRSIPSKIEPSKQNFAEHVSADVHSVGAYVYFGHNGDDDMQFFELNRMNIRSFITFLENIESLIELHAEAAEQEKLSI